MPSSMFLLRIFEFYIFLLILSDLVMKNHAKLSDSNAYKYLIQYWQAVPPDPANDPCQDFSKYVCPPIKKLAREERADGWDVSMDFLDGSTIPDAAGYGLYEVRAAQKSIFNYWDTKYSADDRPAWQKSMKAFYDNCEQYMAAGGVNSDDRFPNTKYFIKADVDALFTSIDGYRISIIIAQMQRDYSSFVKFPFLPWKIETLKNEPGANVPYTINIVEEQHRNPIKESVCLVYKLLQKNPGDKNLSNILKIAVSPDANIQKIGEKVCEILGKWPVDTADPGSFERSFSDLPSLALHAESEVWNAGFCNSDNNWHRNFDFKLYLNEVLSEKFSDDQKVKISSKHLLAKILSILCHLERVYDRNDLGNWENIFSNRIIDFLNANLGTVNNCKSKFRIWAPDVLAYEANERAKANNDIKQSYWYKGFKSGIIMEKIMEILKDGGVSEAQIVNLKRRLRSLVLEMPQSGTDYLVNNYGDNFPTGWYFPNLLLAVLKYNSARNMKPHERDIAYGMNMFLGGPYFGQEVPVFHDIPLRSMFTGPMFSSLPYYDKTLPAFILYANTAMMLAHEMAHALAMPVDSPIHTGFKEFKQCLVNEYSSNNIVENDPLLKVNGKVTLAENFAEYIAWRAARKAFEDIKNASTIPADADWKEWDLDKLFFMAAGANMVTCFSGIGWSNTQLWAIQVNEVHTIGKNRVNEAFKLWPKFAHTFKCDPGTPMGHKKDRCEDLFKI